MKRSLKVDRLFRLGEFKNIRFEDEISELPEDLAMNPDVVKRIRSLQLLQVELDYRRYVELANKFANMSLEESIEYLDKARQEELDELIKLIKNGYDTKE